MSPKQLERIQADCGLSESYPARAESIPRARDTLAGYAAAAGAKAEELDAIRTAASEALTNAVRHAYRDRPGGQIHVSITLAVGELWILIADDGCGLRVRHDSSGLGFGLTLIAQVCDGFTVLERAGGGTEVQMRFVLARSNGPRRGHSRGSVCSATTPA